MFMILVLNLMFINVSRNLGEGFMRLNPVETIPGGASAGLGLIDALLAWPFLCLSLTLVVFAIYWQRAVMLAIPVHCVYILDAAFHVCVFVFLAGFRIRFHRFLVIALSSTQQHQQEGRCHAEM